LFSQGWKSVAVAEALLIDEQTAREYFRTFQHKGLDGLMFRSFLGREPYLNSATQAELAQYLNVVAPASAKEVVVHVREKYGVKTSAPVLRSSYLRSSDEPL
jgi:transposase